jgi:GTP-binding protein HflX
MPDAKAAIISLHNDNKELCNLAASLKYEVIKIFVQRRHQPSAAGYIGPGKIKEIREYIEKTGIDAALVNGELRPSQWYNLERELEIKVYDRLRLILDIFADRAQRKEARLQVQWASLQYERPFIKELIHRTKIGEHPGFMAGGEYPVANYYEMIKKQMKKIQEELKKIEGRRKARRQHRLEKGFYLIAIAGYTNAGKSRLLNRLTDESIPVDGRLFSTLSTTTRRMQQKSHDGTVPLLITDTVGFIQDLPHYVIKAFHATLEEIELSDVVVLLVDGSDTIDGIRKKTVTSLHELRSMGHTPKVVVGLNKADLLTDEQQLERELAVSDLLGDQPLVWLSAKTGYNIDQLVDLIYTTLPKKIHMEVTFPSRMTEKSLATILQENVEIAQIDNGTEDRVYVWCSARVKDKVMGRLQKRGFAVRII